jgi:hypothetical protein
MTLTMTTLNGRLPGHLLAVADTGRNGHQLLRADVTALWRAMLAAGMPAGCLTSGYRTREQQQDEIDRAARGETPSAAPIGQSFHGEGVAADVAEPARAWLRAWGVPFGVIADTVPGERWHFLIDPARAAHQPAPAPITTSTQEEDVIPFIERMYRELNGREGGLVEVAGWADAARTMTAGQVLGAFRAAPAERGTVRAAYLRWLKREPTATDYAERVGRQTIGQVWDALEAASKAGAL